MPQISFRRCGHAEDRDCLPVRSPAVDVRPGGRCRREPCRRHLFQWRHPDHGDEGAELRRGAGGGGRQDRLRRQQGRGDAAEGRRDEARRPAGPHAAPRLHRRPWPHDLLRQEHGGRRPRRREVDSRTHCADEAAGGEDGPRRLDRRLRLLGSAADGEPPSHRGGAERGVARPADHGGGQLRPQWRGQQRRVHAAGPRCRHEEPGGRQLCSQPRRLARRAAGGDRAVRGAREPPALHRQARRRGGDQRQHHVGELRPDHGAGMRRGAWQGRHRHHPQRHRQEAAADRPLSLRQGFHGERRASGLLCGGLRIPGRRRGRGGEAAGGAARPRQALHQPRPPRRHQAVARSPPPGSARPMPTTRPARTATTAASRKSPTTM